MIDRNGSGSIIRGVHFSRGADGSRLAKLHDSDFVESRSQSKIEAFGHKVKLSRPKNISDPPLSGR